VLKNNPTKDCPNNEDETGGIVPCIEASPRTVRDCCGTIMITSETKRIKETILCTATGTNNGLDKYQCDRKLFDKNLCIQDWDQNLN